MKTISGKAVLDTLDELVDPAHTAVISVDIQNDFCHPDGHFARHGKDISAIQKALPTMISFIDSCQAAGLPVVFLRQATLPGGRSDSPAWLRFKTRDGKAPDYTLPGSWGWEFVDGIDVRTEDWVVQKYRPDGFHQTNLDQILRANGIHTVIILGTITEGCVESTVRSASYHDYYTVVVGDGVASPNRRNHECSLALFRDRYPTHGAAEVLAAIRAPR